MQAPLQARNASDTDQANSAATGEQKRGLADSRPAAAAQRKRTEWMNNSPRLLQLRALGDAMQNSPRAVVQRRPQDVKVTWAVTHLVKKTAGSLLGRGSYADGEIGHEGEVNAGQHLVIDDEKTFRSRRGANQENATNREHDGNSVPTVVWYQVEELNNKNVGAQDLFIRAGTFALSSGIDRYSKDHPLNETALKGGEAPFTASYGNASQEAMSNYASSDYIQHILSMERQGPTANFFHHRPAFDKWSEEDMRALPFDSIKTKESEMLDTHVPLYHGQNLQHWANTYFINAFIQKAYLDPAFTDRLWLRNPFDKQNNRWSSVADWAAYSKDTGQELRRTGGTTDNLPGKARVLLSTSPSLMQNSDVKSEESTADYVYSNMSVLKPSETRTLDSLFKRINRPDLESAYTAKLDKLVETELSMDNARGVLYQIFIPHTEVRDLVYISGENGVMDTGNPDPLKTLLSMQVKDSRHMAELTNYKSLQARILMDPLMDPKRKTGVKIIPYFDKNPRVQHGILTVMAEVDKMVAQLIASISA